MKMKKFELDYNYSDKNAYRKADLAIRIWCKRNKGDDCRDMRVRDMIMEVDPNLYKGFTRGDKCRIGRGFSTLYNQGYYPQFERGNAKGVTNTYHLS